MITGATVDCMTDLGGHRITLQMRRDADGGVWSGVDVCRSTCDPDTDGGRSPGRTFTIGTPCPRCGGAGTTEWRRTPMFDHLGQLS